uniref:Uncharacterized protein n=1 Tax=Glossina pallidipes TaxID=7398 RepID=A0A1A9ZYD5_GLOPL
MQLNDEPDIAFVPIYKPTPVIHLILKILQKLLNCFVGIQTGYALQLTFRSPLGLKFSNIYSYKQEVK